MKIPFSYLLPLACAVFSVGAFGSKAAEEPARVSIQKITEPGEVRETAWVIRQTELKKVWEEIDNHICPLKADKTFPYYSYHIIDERYYIVVAYVDKEWKLSKQWMDVTAYCVAQIPVLQEVAFHVKQAHALLDSITSREEGDAKAAELKEIMLKYMEAHGRTDMPSYVFPQLGEYYYQANLNALLERIVDTIRRGSYGSEKLDQFLRGLIP